MYSWTCVSVNVRANNMIAICFTFGIKYKQNLRQRYCVEHTTNDSKWKAKTKSLSYLVWSLQLKFLINIFYWCEKFCPQTRNKYLHNIIQYTVDILFTGPPPLLAHLCEICHWTDFHQIRIFFMNIVSYPLSTCTWESVWRFGSHSTRQQIKFPVKIV